MSKKDKKIWDSFPGSEFTLHEHKPNSFRITHHFYAEESCEFVSYVIARKLTYHAARRLVDSLTKTVEEEQRHG